MYTFYNKCPFHITYWHITLQGIYTPKFGISVTQCGTTSGLTMTFIVSKTKKLQKKVKPPLTEQFQIYGCFQNFFLEK
jgi:hypothetical protein